MPVRTPKVKVRAVRVGLSHSEGRTGGLDGDRVGGGRSPLLSKVLDLSQWQVNQRQLFEEQRTGKIKPP